MELANCIVALGGDITNTVPKHGITPAELCVLLAIHGEGAITDIEITGESVERSNREELERLRAAPPGYGAALNNDGKPIVNDVFPGAGARVQVSFDELELHENLFKMLKAPKTEKSKKKQSADVMA